MMTEVTGCIVICGGKNLAGGPNRTQEGLVMLITTFATAMTGATLFATAVALHEEARRTGIGLAMANQPRMNGAGKSGQDAGNAPSEAVRNSVYEARWLIGPVFVLAFAFAAFAATGMMLT
jgi:hypothetical protein